MRCDRPRRCRMATWTRAGAARSLEGGTTPRPCGDSNIIAAATASPRVRVSTFLRHGASLTRGRSFDSATPLPSRRFGLPWRAARPHSLVTDDRPGWQGNGRACPARPFLFSPSKQKAPASRALRRGERRDSNRGRRDHNPTRVVHGGAPRLYSAILRVAELRRARRTSAWSARAV